MQAKSNAAESTPEFAIRATWHRFWRSSGPASWPERASCTWQRLFGWHSWRESLPWKNVGNCTRFGATYQDYCGKVPRFSPDGRAVTRIRWRLITRRIRAAFRLRSQAPSAVPPTIPPIIATSATCFQLTPLPPARTDCPPPGFTDADGSSSVSPCSIVRRSPLERLRDEYLRTR